MRIPALLSALLVLALALASREAGAQVTTDPAPPAPAPSPPTAGGRIPLVFKNLKPGQVFRIGPSGSPQQEQAVGEDGTVRTEIDAGQIYAVEWGDPDAVHRLRLYPPLPADPASPPSGVEIELRPGLRRVPDQAWNYAWAPGENQKLASLTPPPATPAPKPPAPTPRPAPAPAGLGPEDAARVADLESRVNALSTAVQSARPGSVGTSPAPALWLAVAALALAAGIGIAGVAFYTSVWQPHQRAVAHALDRSLPDALRAQSQEVATLTRRLDSSGHQWQRDLETLRRGQELLATHAGGRGPAPDAAEVARLRAEVERLQQEVRRLAEGSPGG